MLFGDGRHWVCEQARGRVLEPAIGTARNVPSYPADVTVTVVELSPECWRSDAGAPLPT
jgi:hypothetical protein